MADFSGLILGQAQGLEKFHIQGLVVFSVQRPQGLVVFCAQGPQGLVGCCTLTWDQAQGLGEFQVPDHRIKTRSEYFSLVHVSGLVRGKYIFLDPFLPRITYS